LKYLDSACTIGTSSFYAFWKVKGLYSSKLVFLSQNGQNSSPPEKGDFFLEIY
jgi:hypothetical protein